MHHVVAGCVCLMGTKFAGDRVGRGLGTAYVPGGKEKEAASRICPGAVCVHECVHVLVCMCARALVLRGSAGDGCVRVRERV
jgi:hypothetical protein